jgi:hypothetical protein
LLLRAFTPPSRRPLLSEFRILLNLRGSTLLSPGARLLEGLNILPSFSGLVPLALEFTIPLLISHHIILLAPFSRRPALWLVPLESVTLSLVLHGKSCRNLLRLPLPSQLLKSVPLAIGYRNFPLRLNRLFRTSFTLQPLKSLPLHIGY